jgi:hypothetical protein
MGAVDFDPMVYVESEARPVAELAEVAKVSPTSATSAASANPPPSEIADGLRKLETMRAPRWAGGERWRVFVSDVRWLCDTGMVAAALGQGWSLVDLFGVSGDEQWQCLAAWIGGRRDDHGRACYLLTEIRADRTLPYAVQAAGTSRRWHYPEPAPSDAVLPWSM